jgi:hypothetical protein
MNMSMNIEEMPPGGELGGFLYSLLSMGNNIALQINHDGVKNHELQDKTMVGRPDEYIFVRSLSVCV